MIKLTGQYVRKSINEQGELEITLSLKDYHSKKAVEELKKEVPYQIEIKQFRSKRSLNQNAYMWLIIKRIAEKLMQDEMDIYIGLLEIANAKYEYVLGLETIENELKKNFRAVKAVRPQEYNGKKMIVYKCFIGSSKMDTQEMTKLIDTALDWASELDITIEDYYEIY